MEASNISFEQTQLQNELEAINFQLDWLYQRGCNDERLVTRKREIEKHIRNKTTFSRIVQTANSILSAFPDYNPNQPHPYSKK